MESSRVICGAVAPSSFTRQYLRVPSLTLRCISTPCLRSSLSTRPRVSFRRQPPFAVSCSLTDLDAVDTIKELKPTVVGKWKEEFQKSTENLKGDLFGGFTAAIVALPLALAFGVASGAGPLAGLYGATFAGFFAALFGGTPSQITGPTGPMTVVAATLFSTYTSDPTIAFSVVALSGIFQIVMGAMKLGRFIRLVPAPVISGFMSGIGCIILSTQLLPLCGLRAAPDALMAVQALPTLLSKTNIHAFFIGALSFALCTFTPKKITRIVPGSLLALAAGTFITVAAGLNVPLLGHIPSQLPTPMALKFPTALMPMMLKSAFILALLGTIDSLLTSLVADNLTDTYHDSNQEMVGQGIGNAVAGLFGGIPSAGATMRTVVNIRSGGKSRLAGMVHSLLLLAIVMGGGRMAKNIPLAALAGILMKTGWDIIDKRFISRLPKLPPATGIVMWTVLLTTVFVDLIVAVGAGCVMASLLLVNQMAKTEIKRCTVITSKQLEKQNLPTDLSQLEKSLIKSGGEQLGVVKVHGSFTFSAANGILRKVVPATQPLKSIIIDLSSVTLMDGDAVLAIEQLAQRAKTEKKLFMICGASDEICALVEKSGLTAELPLDPSTDRTKCLYLALKETCDVALLPSEADPNYNNAVKLRSTVWTPPVTLPLVSDSDEVLSSKENAMQSSACV